MTQQEIFDKVAIHLLTQGKKSLTGGINGNCMYRGIDNTKCAIGCLIPDELYNPVCEGEIVESPPVLKVLRDAKILSYNQELLDPPKGMVVENKELLFLIQLQQLHDSRDLWEWKDRLIDLAITNNLNTLAIDNLEIAEIVN